MLSVLCAVQCAVFYVCVCVLLKYKQHTDKTQTQTQTQIHSKNKAGQILEAHMLNNAAAEAEVDHV
jgi:hypothetical protein